MSSPQALGPHVQQVHSHGGIFTEVHGDFITYNVAGGSSEAGPLGLLRYLSATGAAFDSLDRSPAPKCHPGTRVELLDEIYTWIDDPQGKKLCWVHGPAGAGKSAIAQTVSETCAERGQLAASFFFSRSTPPRDTSRLFFTTLALQLAESMPHRRKLICGAIQSGVRIVDQHHTTQMERLIVKPLLAPADSEIGTTPPFLVVVDGMDECKPNDDQTRLLKHIYDLVETYQLPLRFLIISRAEPHIHGFFITPRNQNITNEISIYGDYQAHEDVYLFLRSRFDEVAESERHAHSLKYVPRPWPPDDVVALLSDRSGGYFIYASTVLKYVDEEYTSCTVRFQEVLDASTSSDSSGSIFAELDKLYMQILSTCPNPRLLVRILGGMLPDHSGNDGEGDCVEDLDLIYNLRPGESMQTLRGLHSVLKFVIEEFPAGQVQVPPMTRVKPLHASFLDFLHDKARAGDYYVDRDQAFKDGCEGAVSFIRDYESRKSIESTRVNDSLVPLKLCNLFEEFSSTDAKRQRILLNCLDTDTLEKWRISITTMPRFYVLGCLPVLEMILNACSTFSEHKYPHLYSKFNMSLNACFRSQLLPDSSRILQTYLTLGRHIPSFWSNNPVFAASFSTLGLVFESVEITAIDYLCFSRTPPSNEFEEPVVERSTRLSKFLNDSQASGDLYYPEERCYIHITNRWLTILCERAPPTGAGGGPLLAIIADTWGKFLSGCPPGEQSVIDHLRNLDPETTSKHNAEYVIAWLKKSPNPLRDVLSTWENLASERWGIPITPVTTQGRVSRDPKELGVDGNKHAKPKASRGSRVRQGFKDLFRQPTRKKGI